MSATSTRGDARVVVITWLATRAVLLLVAHVLGRPDGDAARARARAIAVRLDDGELLARADRPERVARS